MTVETQKIKVKAFQQETFVDKLDFVMSLKIKIELLRNKFTK